MIALLTLAFAVNILVLATVVPQIIADAPGMTTAYGLDSPARRILSAVYIAILLASISGIAMLVLGMPTHAATIGIALFSVQIIYKTLTWPMVGLDNPVVVANLAINVVLVAGLVGAVGVLRD